MNTEQRSRWYGDSTDLVRRAAVHAALADPARLQIIDTLILGDASSSELTAQLNITTNLLAHHVGVLEAAGLIGRRRSDADRRRQYLFLKPDAPVTAENVPAENVDAGAIPRVLFVCTANTARSQLAAALWRRQSNIPAVSAGTHPAAEVDAGAIAVADRHRLRLPNKRPRHIEQVQRNNDLIITVCDNAHEELSGADSLHWSVPDPVMAGTPTEFDQTLENLTRRINRLATVVSSAG